VSHAEGEPLTSVEEHLAEILGTIRPLAPVELSVGDVHGLVLAEDVTAASPLPSFDNSAMDGYAVRVEDVAAATGENPVTLPVSAEVAAGDTGAHALQLGTSIKIMTGAMLPHGAEAVVPVEWTDGGRTRVTIRARAEYGHAVRLAGGDAKAGEVLVTAGTMLRPMHVAVIAAAGRGSVLVRPRPRVVVLSTGSELAEPGTPVIPGQIWDSNSFMIAAAAREAGGQASRQAILPDRPDEVRPAIQAQLARADLMITTGGVSMGGEHDVVKAALQRLGTITFRKVAMQPGMPQGFGTIERVPIFTLPGNPVSAYVSFQIFARPAIGALQAYDGLGLEPVRAELTGPLRSPPGRRSFARGVLDASHRLVTPLTGQGSHQVATLGKANALVIVPEQVTRMAEGDTADVLVLPLRLRETHAVRQVMWPAWVTSSRTWTAPATPGWWTFRARPSRHARPGRPGGCGCRPRRSRHCAPGTCPRATRLRSPASPGSPGPNGRRT
jgi:molybdopterin molybdotransferase